MSRIGSRVATLRMTVRPFERPDRIVRAIAARAPFGMGHVAAVAGAPT